MCHNSTSALSKHLSSRTHLYFIILLRSFSLSPLQAVYDEIVDEGATGDGFFHARVKADPKSLMTSSFQDSYAFQLPYSNEVSYSFQNADRNNTGNMSELVFEDYGDYYQLSLEFQQWKSLFPKIAFPAETDFVNYYGAPNGEDVVVSGQIVYIFRSLSYALVHLVERYSFQHNFVHISFLFLFSLKGFEMNKHSVWVASAVNMGILDMDQLERISNTSKAGVHEYTL